MDEEWAPGVDMERPSPARMYDYYLGGSHNFAVDRVAAEQVMAVIPNLREIAAANRAFLRRAVMYLLDQGIRQFLDIGSGIPTVGNVHEIARQVDPPARVVYVDTDPVAIAHSELILAGNLDARAIAGDLARPKLILDHPDFRSTVDIRRPVGLLLLSVLPFIPDDQAYPAVAELVAALPSGSYLALSHADGESFDREQHDKAGAVYRRSTSRGGAWRDRAGIARFLTGLELMAPGLVWVTQWRGGELADAGPDPRRIGVLGAIARKP